MTGCREVMKMSEEDEEKLRKEEIMRILNEEMPLLKIQRKNTLGTLLL